MTSTPTAVGGSLGGGVVNLGNTTPGAGGTGMETADLSGYTRHVLKEICSQGWVREKFLKDPEALCTSDLLLDNMLKSKQVREKLSLIFQWL